MNLKRNLPSFFNKSYGFTLIEILVVLSIMTLLFSFGYANFRDYSRRQVLNTFVRQVEGDLRLAQQMAYSGNIVRACGSGFDFIGYVWNYSPTDQKYSLIMRCYDEINSTTSNIYVPDKIINLPDGVTLVSNPSEVLFKVLAGGTDLLDTMTITISRTGITSSGVIQINKTGQISVEYF